MLTYSCFLYLRILITSETMHGGRPHCHGCTESLVVPHFKLRAAPRPSTLVTLVAGWRCSRCGRWRDFHLLLDGFIRRGSRDQRGGRFRVCQTFDPPSQQQTQWRAPSHLVRGQSSRSQQQRTPTPMIQMDARYDDDDDVAQPPPRYGLRQDPRPAMCGTGGHLARDHARGGRRGGGRRRG
ncbi:hypothetical protein LINPERPRIM_LOCUS494 [Linum perenne]